MKPIDVTTLADITDRRMRVYPNGTGRSSGHLGRPAPTIVHGEGYHVWDSSGEKKIDLSNNFTTLVHGHAHPEITAAATGALQNGACFGLPNPDEVSHAEALLARVPWFDNVRYTNSGTEGMMTAVRMARALTGRDKVLGLSHSYHGAADVFLPMTGNIRGVPRSVAEDVLLVAPGDEAGMREAFSAHGDDIAAVVLDLMPMSAGGRPLSPAFVASVESLARQHDVLVIVDEVISFRMAVHGFAEAMYGLRPDLLVTGKVIGGGLPIGAVLGARHVMQILDPAHAGSIDHGGTFSGNPVSMAAGTVAMRILTADEIRRLNELGDRLRQGLQAGGESLGWNANGFGSVVRLEPSADQPVERLRRLFWRTFEEGVSLTPSGTLAVSAPMDEDVIDSLIERITSCFGHLGTGEE